MTPKEAIEILKGLNLNIRPFDNSAEACIECERKYEALTMAIKALETAEKYNLENKE